MVRRGPYGGTGLDLGRRRGSVAGVGAEEVLAMERRRGRKVVVVVERIAW